MATKHGNKWYVCKVVDGKRYTLSFTHDPTKKEIKKALEDAIGQEPENKDSFEYCAKEFIKAKSLLSASTIRAYESYLKNMPQWFKELPMGKIDTLQVQHLVNEYAADHSPKYTRNIHGFISSVLGMFVPELVLRTTLPHKEPTMAYEPSENDIKEILKASKGTQFEVALWLACYGLRRSEQICLTDEDIDFGTGIISITKAKVQDKDGNWVLKPYTKNDSSTRQICVDNYVLNLIKQNGFYDGHPNSIVCWLYKTQNQLGIPNFSLHYFRHYFASKMSTVTDEATLLKLGGWKTDYVMKSHYRYALSENLEKAQKDAASLIQNLK